MRIGVVRVLSIYTIRCKSVFVRGGFQKTGPGGYGAVFVLVFVFVGPRIPAWGALTDPESEAHAPPPTRVSGAN